MFDLVARSESNDICVFDVLIEKDYDASTFGSGAEQYEIQQLLEIIPTLDFLNVEDRNFVKSVQGEEVALW